MRKNIFYYIHTFIFFIVNTFIFLYFYGEYIAAFIFLIFLKDNAFVIYRCSLEKIIIFHMAMW